MIIYTGQTGGYKLDIIKKLGMGIMLSSHPTTKPTKQYGEVPCALDNGAFACYKKGYPFMEKVFYDTLESAYKGGIQLDFIVCPDIVAGGVRSLELSLKHAETKLLGVKNLALVLQDGIEPSDLTANITRHFSYLFLGGTKEWKWKNARMWVDVARDKNKKIHIGQCGRLEYLRYADSLGVDSVDSTSFTRNNSYHIVSEFLNSKQRGLFDLASA